MLLSIIVPVYNTEEYLERCLDSIFQQSFQEYEVIIVDDGAQDSSPAICDKYAMKDKRVKVIHKENGGVSSARNRGVELATGKYVWFVDSDDMVADNALKRLEKIMKKDIDLIVFNSQLEEESQVEDMDIFFKNFYFTYQLSFCPWNKLYKRDLIIKNSIHFDEEEKIGEDLLFNVSYYRHIQNIVFLNEEFYDYIIRENSAMTTLDDKRYIKQMRLFDKIRVLLSEEISENSIMCLYFMHLISGLNQTSNGGLSIKERVRIAHEYHKKYKWNKDVYQKGLETFLSNENSSILGRIRAKYLYGYWRVK